MTRTLSIADYPAAVSAEAHRLDRVILAAQDDIEFFRGQIKRGVNVAVYGDRIRWSQGCIDCHLAMLGELMVRSEDLESGDRLIVGGSLYSFDQTGATMRVKIAGQWEDVDAYMAKFEGPAPLPGSDDPLPDEISEWKFEHSKMVV